jgi:predicted DCC family thiol-disulfide oxidoreductase YuxK
LLLRSIRDSSLLSPYEDDTNAIILFDGVCNFCNRSVNLVIKRDRRGYFRFAPLQEPKGAEVARRYGVDPTKLDTFVLVENGRAYRKSGGALRVARRLGGVYALAFALIIVPPFVRDFFYDWFARRRYRWFGKRDACMVPTAEVRERFLTEETSTPRPPS